MRTKSAIFYAAHEPIRVEEVELDPPQHRELLVRVAATGACHRRLPQPWTATSRCPRRL